MKANTIFNLTSPSKQMPGDVFEALLEKAKLSILNENDFEYRGKHNNYEIGFALINGNLDVDVFGKWHKNTDWIELTPTTLQSWKMIAKLSRTVIETEHEPLPYVDEYWENGVRREDFY